MTHHPRLSKAQQKALSALLECLAPERDLVQSATESVLSETRRCDRAQDPSQLHDILRPLQLTANETNQAIQRIYQELAVFRNGELAQFYTYRGYTIRPMPLQLSDSGRWSLVPSPCKR